MSSSILTHVANLDSAPASARVVLRLMQKLRHGTLDLQLPDGSVAHFGQAGGTGGIAPLGQPLHRPIPRGDGGRLGSGPAPGPRAAMRLANWKVCAAALKSGDIGVAETFIAGDWTTPDLTALLTLFVANRDAIESVVYGRRWGSLLYRLKHAFHRNSRRGSRKNIHAHYDLGNAFYAHWLDPSMNYSSAWFDGDARRDLTAAQTAKIDRALAECRVGPGDRVLEIGCGWGALAERAAQGRGAHVTGVTLSAEQLAWAEQRLADAGLASDLRFQDYRDIDDGPFDAIVSIEMFEAVGRDYWPSFFGTLRTQLKPGGRACIQTITIRDDLFERYRRSTDFIQQYVFPGGLLPSAAAFREAAAAAGLRVVAELAFGQDYAETLKRWRERFLAAETPIRQLGFDTRFLRTWEFYLAYCEAAFATGNTGVVQFTLRPV